MTNRRLKKSVVPVLYAVLVLLFVGSIYLLERAIVNYSFDEDDYDYVSETIFENETPVINTDIVIVKPYNDSNVKIVKQYYDYQADQESQENAIIYHENTYLQNSGVAYQGNETFDVVAILDGEVIDVTQDNLLGTIVQIKHENDMISIYQSLGETSLKKGDIVNQGQIIGRSGTSNISTELGNHLLFELIIKGQTVNPEEYYDKKLNEI